MKKPYILARLLALLEDCRTKRLRDSCRRFGAASSMEKHCVIRDPDRVEIGAHVRINEAVCIHGGGGVTIDDYSTLSMGCTIVSCKYNIDDWLQDKRSHVVQPVYIGKHVWIGANATILGGVQITGSHVIVAAGSVVTKSIPESYVLYAGNPARKIKAYRPEKV